MCDFFFLEEEKDTETELCQRINQRAEGYFNKIRKVPEDYFSVLLVFRKHSADRFFFFFNFEGGHKEGTGGFYAQKVGPGSLNAAAA